jgi:hypothetical protein
VTGLKFTKNGEPFFNRQYSLVAHPGYPDTTKKCLYIPSTYYKWMVDKIKLKATAEFTDDAVWGPVIPC